MSLSPVGVFLRLIAEAAEDCESETKFITLLKHPFMLCGQDAADFRKKAYAYETAMRQKGKSPMPPVLESFFYQIKKKLVVLISNRCRYVHNRFYYTIFQGKRKWVMS